MPLEKVWEDTFEITRKGVLTVYARNTDGTDLYYGSPSTGVDGTRRAGYINGSFWHDNNHQLVRPDTNLDGLDDTGLPIIGVGSINLPVVCFHPAKKSPGFCDYPVERQTTANIPGIPGDQLKPWDLRGGEFRATLALENFTFAPGARLLFWFQTFDNMAGQYHEGMDVNYMQVKDPVCTQLGVPCPTYRGGNTVTLSTDYIEVRVRLDARSNYWRAMSGNTAKNNRIYGRSMCVGDALESWGTDMGLILFNGPNPPSTAQRNRGTIKLDSVSLWLPSAPYQESAFG